MSGIASEIFVVVSQLDEKLKRTDTAFMVAAILIAALKFGADEDEIAYHLGYAPEFVSTIGQRLRKSGVWEGLTSAHQNAWSDSESGGMAFWMDVTIGEGFIECCSGPGEEPQYRMTEEARREVEKKLRRRGHDRH